MAKRMRLHCITSLRIKWPISALNTYYMELIKLKKTSASVEMSLECIIIIINDKMEPTGYNHSLFSVYIHSNIK